MGDSGKVYGYRKLADDLRYGGKPAIVADNTLDRQFVFDDIEVFYNPTRKHSNNVMRSPGDDEAEQKKMNKAGV